MGHSGKTRLAVKEEGSARRNGEGDWRSSLRVSNEQASQIQKVSAQLEASKPEPQVVNNP